MTTYPVDRPFLICNLQVNWPSISNNLTGDLMDGLAFNWQIKMTFEIIVNQMPKMIGY